MENTKNLIHFIYKIICCTLFTLLFIGLFIFPEEAHGQVSLNQDTISINFYHEVNPTTHVDTIFVKGPVRYLLDSTGVGIFIYDPNLGIHLIDRTLSSGLISN